MYEIKIIKHSEITKEFLDKIIIVKNAAWPYSNEEQEQWIKENINELDIHTLLLENGKPLAYINLIKIHFSIDARPVSGFGIGNVCALEKGKGWGKYILKGVNQFLDINNQIGVLFCKEVLVEFYLKNDWVLVEKEKLSIN